MAIFGYWYGGANYYPPQKRDLEYFSDLEDVKTNLKRRYRSNGKYTITAYFVFELLNGDKVNIPRTSLYPGVSTDCEIHCWNSMNVSDKPDFVVRFNPLMEPEVIQ